MTTTPLSHDSTATVIKLTNQIVRDAIHDGASEIVLESGQDLGTVSYMVEGSLSESIEVAPETMPMIVRRLGLLSKLNLFDGWMRPQDGTAKVRVRGNPYELGVSYLPTGVREQMSMQVSITPGVDQA